MHSFFPIDPIKARLFEAEATNVSYDANPQRFHYHPLEDNQIRIWDLDPGDETDPLSGTMYIYNLERSKNFGYNACSYCWGDLEEQEQIVVNGWPTEITKNLATFLRHLRSLSGGKKIRLWIDRLCINQSDPTDKAQQIPLMKSIYEKADYVLVWLGPAADDSDLAIALLLRLHRLLMQQLDKYETAWAVMSYDNIPMSEVFEAASDENVRAWRALPCLLNRDYWFRTWILQEITAKPRNYISVFCGDKSIGYGPVLSGRDWLKVLQTVPQPPGFDPVENETGAIGRILMFARRVRDDSFRPYLHLLKLLEDFRRNVSTDPRDKVFSMLDFAFDTSGYRDDELLAPDYTKSVEEVYCDLIKWHVTKYRNLDFLGYCSHADANWLNLPLWMPDWSGDTRQSCFKKYLDVSASPKVPTYTASGRFTEDLPLVTAFPDRPDHLAVSGLRLGKIADVLEPVSEIYWDTSVEESWMPSNHDSNCPLTNKPLSEVYAHTVVADLTTLDYRRGIYERGGMMQWPKDKSAGMVSEADDIALGALKHGCCYRRLFYFSASANTQLQVMGLGSHKAQPGDQIFALNGGKVLYILREFGMHSNCNISPMYEEGMQDRAIFMMLSGVKHPWTEIMVGKAYLFVGECFVYGLMDGEAVNMLDGTRPKPVVLDQMGEAFEEIIILSGRQ